MEAVRLRDGVQAARKLHLVDAAATRMKFIGLCLLFALAIQKVCCADVTKLSAEDRKALQNSSRFHKVYSTGDLPAAIVAPCTGNRDKLAEPGQK
jgi:hypothetical protein